MNNSTKMVGDFIGRGNKATQPKDAMCV